MSQLIKIFQYDGTNYQEYSPYFAIQSQTANNSEYLGGIINTDYALKAYVDEKSIKKSETFQIDWQETGRISYGKSNSFYLNQIPESRHFLIDVSITISLYMSSAQTNSGIYLGYTVGTETMLSLQCPKSGGTVSGRCDYRLIGNKTKYATIAGTSIFLSFGSCTYGLAGGN